jgi:hypothetical protein
MMAPENNRRWLPWALLGIGLASGLLVGLMSPWQLRLIERQSARMPALPEALREPYVLWVSDSYAADGDLGKARDRLAVLGGEDMAIVVGEIASGYVEKGEDVEATRRVIALAQGLGVDDETLAEYMIATAPTATATQTNTPTATPTASPTPTWTPSPVPTATSTPPPSPTSTATAVAAPTPAPRDWDPRLNYFYPLVRLEQAQAAGQWYWRLIKTVWQDEWEAGGRHHIYVEVLDEKGDRSFGQTVIVEYGGSTHPFPYPDTEKLAEEYAFNFIMHDVLGGYNVYMGGPEPSDKVYGLGLGTVQNRDMNYHTCFLLTFQRTYQP